MLVNELLSARVLDYYIPMAVGRIHKFIEREDFLAPLWFTQKEVALRFENDENPANDKIAIISSVGEVKWCSLAPLEEDGAMVNGDKFVMTSFRGLSGFVYGGLSLVFQGGVDSAAYSFSSFIKSPEFEVDTIALDQPHEYLSRVVFA